MVTDELGGWAGRGQQLLALAAVEWGVKFLDKVASFLDTSVSFCKFSLTLQTSSHDSPRWRGSAFANIRGAGSRGLRPEPIIRDTSGKRS
jgi:hypothetical protein